MSPLPSNETYYRRYLDDPLVTPTMSNPIPQISTSTSSLSVESASENLALHNTLSQQQQQFNQQFFTLFPK